MQIEGMHRLACLTNIVDMAAEGVRGGDAKMLANELSEHLQR